MPDTLKLEGTNPTPHNLKRFRLRFWFHVRVNGVRQSIQLQAHTKNPFLGELYLSFPSQKLQEECENKRKEVMNFKYAGYLQRIKEERKRKEKEPKDLFKEALELYKQGKLFGTTGRTAGKISAYRIMEELGVSQALAYAIKHKIEEYIGHAREL